MTTVLQNLLDRGMDPERYHVIIDEDERMATFLLFDMTGRITGYQQYRPDSMQKKTNDQAAARYYTYVPRMVDAMFGLETVRVDSDPVIIVEGVFKATKLHSLGYTAIAVLTCDPKRLRPLFRILRQARRLFAIGDPDSAGQKLVNRTKAGFCSVADLDEMSDADVTERVELYLKTGE